MNEGGAIIWNLWRWWLVHIYGTNRNVCFIACVLTNIHGFKELCRIMCKWANAICVGYSFFIDGKPREFRLRVFSTNCTISLKGFYLKKILSVHVQIILLLLWMSVSILRLLNCSSGYQKNQNHEIKSHSWIINR